MLFFRRPMYSPNFRAFWDGLFGGCGGVAVVGVVVVGVLFVLVVAAFWSPIAVVVGSTDVGVD